MIDLISVLLITLLRSIFCLYCCAVSTRIHFSHSNAYVIFFYLSCTDMILAKQLQLQNKSLVCFLPGSPTGFEMVNHKISVCTCLQYVSTHICTCTLVLLEYIQNICIVAKKYVILTAEKSSRFIVKPKLPNGKKVEIHS